MRVDAPLQTNAANKQQVEQAEDYTDLAERQVLADARAEIADYDARRRCWPIVRAVLMEVVGPFATDAACREYAVVQRLHKERIGLWRGHRELFAQMVAEGLKRDADEDKRRVAMLTPSSTEKDA